MFTGKLRISKSVHLQLIYDTDLDVLIRKILRVYRPGQNFKNVLFHILKFQVLKFAIFQWATPQK